MRRRSTISGLIVIICSISGNEMVPAAVLLNQGFLFSANAKSVTAVNNKGEKFPQADEVLHYPGLAFGLDVPVMPNSFGIVSFLGISFGSQLLNLNQYNIENYEYTITKADGTSSNVISTAGNLKDFNLQEKVGRYMRDNPGNYPTRVHDIVLQAALLFRYSFPVEIPSSNRFVNACSRVLSVINPYIAAGFSNIIINRRLDLNESILNAIKAEHGAVVTGKNEYIAGVDPAPDPDFYLTGGVGLNLMFPQLKPFGNQAVITIEVLWHFGLSPDDMQKPYDDQYVISQNGLTVRLATGIVL